MKSIWVYNDIGTDLECVHQTRQMIQDFVNPYMYRIELIKAKDIISLNHNQCRMENIELMIMPGGRDLPYCNKLNGIGVDMIKKYLYQYSGKYIGICAGAYFACKQLHWALKTKWEICQTRELELFDGIACGPCIKPYYYNSFKGATCVDIYVKELNQNIPCYYNGGGHFIPYSIDNDGYNVLGYFKNNVVKHKQHKYCVDSNCSNGIIYKEINNGARILLSGVHFEFNGDFFNDNFSSHHNTDLNGLSNDNSKELRHQLVSYLLNKLGIHLRSSIPKL